MAAIFSDMLGLHGENDLGFLQVILRAFIVFVATLILARIAHKRFFAKKNAFDVIMALILASMLARTINGKEPLFPTLAGGLFLVLLHRTLSWIAFRFPGFDNLIKGHRNCLIVDGVINREVLQKHSVTEEDLTEQLRLRKVQKAQDVRAAYLERSGEVSVLPRE